MTPSTEIFPYLLYLIRLTSNSSDIIAAFITTAETKTKTQLRNQLIFGLILILGFG